MNEKKTFLLLPSQVTAPTCSTPQGGEGGRKEVAYEVVRISQVRISGDPPVYIYISLFLFHLFTDSLFSILYHFFTSAEYIFLEMKDYFNRLQIVVRRQIFLSTFPFLFS